MVNNFKVEERVDWDFGSHAIVVNDSTRGSRERGNNGKRREDNITRRRKEESCKWNKEIIKLFRERTEEIK